MEVIKWQTLFIFLIVSRLVLSDTTPFGEHVITTKNLLEDIEKVEKAASQDSLNQNYTYKQNNAFMKFNYIYTNITDVSYKNFNENKSVITLMLDKEKNRGGEILIVFPLFPVTLTICNLALVPFVP